MSMPFYVAPEQVMKDRADYARKGIARGRSLAALSYEGGIVVCAENPSNTLHKVAEIYDRIAFAGVGKYNEFDQLRKFGVRTADPAWARRLVASLGGAATVEEPPELADEIAADARAALARYADRPGG